MSRPLPLHANRVFSFLQKTGFIDHESRFLPIAEQFIRIFGHIIHQAPVAPWRRADELLHALIIAVCDIVLDGLDVHTSLRTQQAGEIIARMTDTVAALADEMPFVFFAESPGRGRYSAQRGYVIFYLAGFSMPRLGLRCAKKCKLRGNRSRT